MQMPCGAFKGRDIELLPSRYLRWVAENWAESTPKNKAICEAADKEWRYREENGCHFDETD